MKSFVIWGKFRMPVVCNLHTYQNSNVATGHTTLGVPYCEIMQKQCIYGLFRIAGQQSKI